MALGLGLLDEVCLVLGQHLGKEAVHAHLLCNSSGGALTVAGHHDGVPDAQRTQSVQHSGGFRAQRVGNADHTHQLAAGCHVQVRIRGLEGIELLLLGCGDGALFILKDEVVTANDHALAAHAACNAVGHDVLHLGVHLLMGNAAFLGGTHHGVGHGMGEVLFQTCGQLQNFALVAAGEGHDLHYLRGGTGEGAGLVEHDSVGLRQRFQILAALDGDVVAAALAHGGKHGQRHGELERAGEIHHQAGDGAGGVAGEQIGDHRCAQTPWHQLVGQHQRTVLGAGLELSDSSIMATILS